MKVTRVDADTGDAAAIISAVQDLSGSELIGLPDPRLPNDAPMRDVLIVPQGKSITSIKKYLDEYLPKPVRRTGTAHLTDLASFIDHTNRFKDQNSAIFATRSEAAPALLSVLDYHPGTPDNADARFGSHRGRYDFPVSEQWQAWQAIDGKTMGQADFATFIEERIMDILQPPEDPEAEAGALARDLLRMLGGTMAGPTQLLETARGLRLMENAQVTNAVNIATGEVEISYRTEHHDQQGQPVRVPTLFLVGMPVFEGDAAYKLPVRLQYRRKEGMILWTVRRYRPELVFFHAFDEAVNRVRAGTGLPVLIGSPEAAA